MNAVPTGGAQQGAIHGQWRFGAVAVDEDQARVTVEGRPLALDRSSYDILLTLLRHAGEVVTKDELLAMAWPGRVVSENSLAKGVSRLRKAFGDADGTLIRAAHGYGYRLAAQVTFVPRALDAAHASPANSEQLALGEAMPWREGWRVVRQLASSSYSTVYLAESAMGESRVFKVAKGEQGLLALRREVALHRYLQASRSPLPGLVPVIGCNLSQSPFFCGIPFYPAGDLMRWAENQGGLAKVALEERLRLLVQVCETVAALHDAGINHNDIKPGNIFIATDQGDGSTRQCRALLGDLGAGITTRTLSLAELTASLLVADPADISNGLQGSAMYFAPEVLAGEMATSRSDVFSLGVLLYQLVCADFRRPLAAGWEADIEDELLREDIAAAAATQPARRLADAGQLASRLATLGARHRASDEEKQREREIADRLAQFERARSRRRLLTWLAGALAIGLAIASWMYLRAARSEQRAFEQAQQSQAVLDFVANDVLAKASPYERTDSQGEVTVRETMETAAPKIDKRFAGQPAIAAELHRVIGNVYFGISDLPSAIAQYERARTIAIATGSAGNPALARIESEYCNVLRMADRVGPAEAMCRDAIARYRKMGVDEPRAVIGLAKLKAVSGECNQARDLLLPLVDSPALQQLPNARADVHWFLGLSYQCLADYAKSRDHFERLLQLQLQAHGQRHPLTAWAYSEYAGMLVESADYDRAIPMLQKSRDIFHATLGVENPESSMPDYWLALADLERGEWQPAIAIYRPLVDKWSATLGTDHLWTLQSMADLGLAEAESGDAAGARGMLAKSRDGVARSLPGDSRELEYFLRRWIATDLLLGNASQAQSMLRQLDLLQRQVMGPGPHPAKATALCLHARLALAQRQQAQARQFADTCRQAMLAIFPANSEALHEPDAVLALASAAPRLAGRSAIRQ